MRRLLTATLALAIPSLANAAPCVPGTLADYISLGAGCTAGGTLFAGFASGSLDPLAAEIPATKVSVSPLATGVGLSFGLDVNAQPGDLFDILIHYTVSGLLFRIQQPRMSGSAATADGVGDGRRGQVRRRLVCRVRPDVHVFRQPADAHRRRHRARRRSAGQFGTHRADVVLRRLHGDHRRRRHCRHGRTQGHRRERVHDRARTLNASAHRFRFGRNGGASPAGATLTRGVEPQTGGACAAFRGRHRRAERSSQPCERVTTS